MKYLFITGAVPFVLLGVLHITYSLIDERRPRRLMPRDRDLLEGMRTGTLVLTKETTVWRAWIGFNLSHGLGVVLFSAALVYIAALHFEPVRNAAPEVLVAAPVIAAVYLGLSLRYWFSIPAIGSGLGTGLLLAGAVATLAGA
ncbi:MAG TPA: hypothetical protein VM325_11860 [Alphaproteobacteria bacterium]|nr:hypothetical protein [Alphaproteobacteria bacterium]